MASLRNPSSKAPTWNWQKSWKRIMFPFRWTLANSMPRWPLREPNQKSLHSLASSNHRCAMPQRNSNSKKPRNSATASAPSKTRTWLASSAANHQPNKQLPTNAIVLLQQTPSEAGGRSRLHNPAPQLIQRIKGLPPDNSTLPECHYSRPQQHVSENCRTQRLCKRIKWRSPHHPCRSRMKTQRNRHADNHKPQHPSMHKR